MPQYDPRQITAKKGVNYVRGVIESAGSIFHKIEQENDLGIDAQVELIEGRKPLNIQFAAQIKCGESYYQSRTKTCIIPIDNHRDYWSSYPLDVIGFVVVPSLKSAYWVDLKKALACSPEKNRIKFNATEANLFNTSAFEDIFYPRFTRQIPNITLDRAIAFLNSDHEDERTLGLLVLFRRFCNDYKTWDTLVDHFLQYEVGRVSPHLIYYLAHIPWHGDIWAFGEMPSQTTKVYVSKKFEEFGIEEVVKLLYFIDDDDGITRGSIGQSVEAIISSLSKSDTLLNEIARDTNYPITLRGHASIILAMSNPQAALDIFEQLSKDGWWFAAELSNYISEYGSYNPYS